jgi:hypothetical protein
MAHGYSHKQVYARVSSFATALLPGKTIGSCGSGPTSTKPERRKCPRIIRIGHLRLRNELHTTSNRKDAETRKRKGLAAYHV